MKELPGGLLEHAAVQYYIGDASGLDALDLACGTGFYSQKLLESGAKAVVGLDISAAMVAEARQLSSCNGRIDFRVADCSRPLDVGKFDLVLAAFLLNYAGTEDELLTMWQNIAGNLKPGGRCIGLIPNRDLLQLLPSEHRGVYMLEVVEHVKRGVKCRISVSGPAEFSFETFMLDPELYEKCARDAGIHGFQWMPPVNPNDPQVDFEGFLRCPHFRLFVANT